MSYAPQTTSVRFLRCRFLPARFRRHPVQHRLPPRAQTLVGQFAAAADAVRALLAKPHRGLLHDPGVGFLLVLLRIAHRGPIKCLKSYNNGNGEEKLPLSPAAPAPPKSPVGDP